MPMEKGIRTTSSTKRLPMLTLTDADKENKTKKPDSNTPPS
jgi:hypothetical protein